jgi:hypothetical protein
VATAVRDRSAQVVSAGHEALSARVTRVWLHPVGDWSPSRGSLARGPDVDVPPRTRSVELDDAPVVAGATSERGGTCHSPPQQKPGIPLGARTERRVACHAADASALTQPPPDSEDRRVTARA